MKEFNSYYDCYRNLCSDGFCTYLPLRGGWYLFRKVEDNTITKFAKIEYNTVNGLYHFKIATWPEKRYIVKLSDAKYWKDTLNMLEWLKNYDPILPNNNGIQEPIISNISKENNEHLFSFFEQNFAVEFKLIWG